MYHDNAFDDEEIHFNMPQLVANQRDFSELLIVPKQVSMEKSNSIEVRFEVNQISTVYKEICVKSFDSVGIQNQLKQVGDFPEGIYGKFFDSVIGEV